MEIRQFEIHDYEILKISYIHDIYHLFINYNYCRQMKIYEYTKEYH